MQVRLSGFWPVVVSTLVALIGRWLLRLLTPGEPGLFPGEKTAVLCSTALCMAVLSLADQVFDGMALAPGPGWQRWLTSLALAALFVVLAGRWQVTGPGMSVVLVRIMSGVLAFGLTAAALTLAVWPARINRAAAEHPRDPVHA
jgi:hypothetical protein